MEGSKGLMPLDEYAKKRRFENTPNLLRQGQEQVSRRLLLRPTARRTRLHYDFRLAVDGVLKSWAVPRGRPSIRR